MTLDLRRFFHKLDFIDIKNFSASQDTINTEKASLQNERIIFENYTSDKG